MKNNKKKKALIDKLITIIDNAKDEEKNRKIITYLIIDCRINGTIFFSS